MPRPSRPAIRSVPLRTACIVPWAANCDLPLVFGDARECLSRDARKSLISHARTSLIPNARTSVAGEARRSDSSSGAGVPAEEVRALPSRERSARVQRAQRLVQRAAILLKSLGPNDRRVAWLLEDCAQLLKVSTLRNTEVEPVTH